MTVEYRLYMYANPCEPNASPNAGQWNIVRVGYARIGVALGMSISYSLCQFHF